jgi:hypothetical protein
MAARGTGWNRPAYGGPTISRSRPYGIFPHHAGTGIIERESPGVSGAGKLPSRPDRDTVSKTRQILSSSLADNRPTTDPERSRCEDLQLNPATGVNMTGHAGDRR